MRNSTAHMLNAIWRSFIGVMIAFALMFSTSLYASASILPQPLDKTAANHTIITQNHNGNREVMRMTDNVDCCDEDGVPCDNNNCDIPCLSISVPHAVITPESSELLTQGLAAHTYNYTLKDGISGRLNAPPPRV